MIFMERKTYTVDADGKSIGRLASEIARLLQGKHKPMYVPYKDGGDFVEVKNIDKVKFTGEKLNKKVYYRHSGYPGGLKAVAQRVAFEGNPAWVLKRAVLGMLPKNKLRAKRIKRLIVVKKSD